MRTLLGGHVLRRTNHEIGSRDVSISRIRLLNLGNSKVEDLCPVAAVGLGDHYIVALEIAMHHALFMRDVQSTGNLAHNFDDAIHSHRPFALDDFL